MSKPKELKIESATYTNVEDAVHYGSLIYDRAVEMIPEREEEARATVKISVTGNAMFACGVPFARHELELMKSSELLIALTEASYDNRRLRNFLDAYQSLMNAGIWCDLTYEIL